MVYLLKTKLPENKSIFFSLFSVYGIGKGRSKLICKTLGFLKTLKVKNMIDEQFSDLSNLVNKLALDVALANELKKLLKQNQKKLASIGLYRGIRLKKGLPARGQRTHSNAQTASRFVNRSEEQQKHKKKEKSNRKKK
jgi:small subunit ribosomal protein S13